MKHNVRRLLALATVLAMLLSLFAVAEDGMTEMGMDQPIEIEGGTGNNGDTQGQEGELEFDMDEGERLDGVTLDEDAALDGDAALTLDAQIDLQAGALVFGSEETDSVTEEAAMDGDHTHDGQTFKSLNDWLKSNSFRITAPTT
jgi:hypothetical protein